MNKQTRQTSSHLPDAEHKKDFVRQGFDSIAKKYDLLNDVMTMGMHRSWKNEVVKRLKLNPGMKVLDLCAGTGDLAYRSSQMMNHQGLVVALDFSQQMMAYGKKRMFDHNQPNPLHWLNADACQLPFPDNCFDAASVGFGLRNVTSIKTCLAEVFRVLKPGGRFVNLDTAASEWALFNWGYKLHMNFVVPTLGKVLAGSQPMYSYLSASAAAFETPKELATLFEQAGFVKTGYAYRPRALGGAALVWGIKPNQS